MNPPTLGATVFFGEDEAVALVLDLGEPTADEVEGIADPDLEFDLDSRRFGVVGVGTSMRLRLASFLGLDRERIGCGCGSSSELTMDDS